MRLQDRAAIITGGANGIGRATAELFAREGARVVIADRDHEAGQQAAEAIRQAGGEALFAEADVAREDEVRVVVWEAVHRYGGIDILVNCAGIAVAGSVVDTDRDRWQRVLDVNLASAYLFCRNAIPRMIARGGGSIVNIASVQGMYGYRGWAAYAASKAGLIGLTRQVAVEYAEHNIRCNAISPGAIETRLALNTSRLEPTLRPPGSDPAPHERTDPRPHLLRPGRPEHVARAVLFFACDDSEHITGQNLVVDGGASSRIE